MITDTALVSIFFLITFIITFIITYKVIYDEELSWTMTSIVATMKGSAIAFVIALVVVGLLGIDSKVVNYKYEIQYNIYSLRNSSETNGSFTLGSGTINEVEYCYVMYKTENGAYRRHKIPMDQIEIIESSKLAPAVYAIENIYESRSGIIKYTNFSSRDKGYRIVVPKGTVIEQFKLY